MLEREFVGMLQQGMRVCWNEEYGHIGAENEGMLERELRAHSHWE